jgi:hypothetical protein
MPNVPFKLQRCAARCLASGSLLAFVVALLVGPANIPRAHSATPTPSPQATTGPQVTTGKRQLLPVLLHGGRATSSPIPTPPTPTPTPSPSAPDSDYRFPAPLIANVRDYGAIGDGSTDDTAAIQRAICENIGRKMVYFPIGTYLVSNRLEGKDCDGKWTPFLTLIGQRRDATVIKLRPDAPGYGDAAKPRAVIYTASGWFTGGDSDGGKDYQGKGEGNEAFSNYVEHLTVDTGTNPGAMGIDFLASNRGAVRDVLIRGQGVVGLSMQRRWPGPLLIKNVAVEGFDYGIATSLAASYGVTMEHLQLSGQRKAAIFNDGEALSIRNLSSVNSVPAIHNQDEVGMITLIDADLRGGAPTTSAIRNLWGEHRYHKGALFLRNVRAEGYRAVAEDGDELVGNTTIAEYSSNGQLSLFPSQLHTLGLAVAEPPVFHDNDLANWANVLDYGAKLNDWGDDGAALQRALDSGKATIYFPSGVYHVGRTLRVGPGVRRIIGPHATLSVAWGVFTDTAQAKPMFLVEGQSADALSIEGLSIDNHFQNQGDQPGLVGVEQASSRPLLLKDWGCCNLNGVFKQAYRSAEGAGPLFIENVSASRWLWAHPQQIWARQFNPEGWDLHARNSGATLWVLGFKTEGRGMVLRTDNGGQSEVLGGVTYSFDRLAPDETPFEVVDARAALVFATTTFDASMNWPSLVRETRNGVTRSLPNHTGVWRGLGTMLPLYVGAPAQEGQPTSGEGTGLRGSYFDAPDFTQLKATRIDNTIDFDWKSWFRPIDAIDHVDNYSIRWTGSIEVPVSGAYRLVAQGDDTATLWVDGQEVGDDPLTLQAGRRYPLRLDFVQRSGSAWVTLRWQLPGQERATVIPRSQLYPPSDP